MSGGGKGGFLKSIGQYMEKSALIDIGTVGVLGLNLYLLNSYMDFGESLFQLPGELNTLAAQLTLIMISVYFLEAFADKAKSGGGGRFGY